MHAATRWWLAWIAIVGVAASCATFGAEPSAPVELEAGAPDAPTEAIVVADAPVVVDAGTSSVIKVAAGPYHTCAVFDDGRLKCWGSNTHGSLGLGNEIAHGDGRDGGTMGSELLPVQLGTGRKAIDVALGGSVTFDVDAGTAPYLTTCALLDDRTVKCWGYNGSGQLGQGNTNNLGFGPNQMGDNLHPVSLAGPVEQLALGAFHACALLVDGRVQCWGYGYYGALGLGDRASRGGAPGELGPNLPAVDLGAGVLAKQIATGAYHSCALLADGRVKCWGNNANGELGLGDAITRGDDGGMGDALPAVDLGAKAKAIACGAQQACAILEGDFLKCWGVNTSGQLGVGDLVTRGSGLDGGAMGAALLPIDLGDVPVAVSGGVYSFCAVLANKTLKCWGYNVSGVLGTNDLLSRGGKPNEMGSNLFPVTIADVKSVTVGYLHACAATGGGVKCWGGNVAGELGLGDTVSRGGQPGDMGGLPFVNLGP